MTDLDIYAVHVVFLERGYWSKSHTYKSKEFIDLSSVVVVPTNEFYSVGKVTGCEKGYKFKDGIMYKSITQIVKK